MDAVFGWIAGHPELLVFSLVGLGAVIGHWSLRGVSLGAAAVLFAALGLSAWSQAVGVELMIPAAVGHIGLALFTFSIGISSGPGFFHTLRSSGTIVGGVVLAIVAGALVAAFLGPALGLTRLEAAGTFAGATTNTPALAATGDSAEATVGYAVAYIFGVVGMMWFVGRALSHRSADTGVAAPLIQVDVQVEHVGKGSVADLEMAHNHQVTITRIRREEDGPVTIAFGDEPLEVGDVVTVVGTRAEVAHALAELGHESSDRLTLDQRDLGYRRITVSDPAVAGKTIGELKLDERFRALVSRVRRGDTDLVANSDMVLLLGDRVRVVAPRDRIGEVSTFFGDSARGLTEVNPAALGLGMAAGIGLGAIPFPLPGGGSFTLGAAVGTLLVGLVLGRVGHVGRFNTTLPFTVTAVISELGLLIFLAATGTRAGGVIGNAFASGDWLRFFVLGVCITLIVGAITYVFQSRACDVRPTQLAGVLGGTQTQPALLAYANNQTKHDNRVAMGYAMAYPAAMVAKILLAGVLRLLP